MTQTQEYGNRPGDGALRYEGVPVASVGSQQEDLPSSYSPQAERQRPALKVVRDLWGGTEKLKAAGTTYLPQAPGERQDDYNHRLSRAVFFNAFRRSVEGLCGLVFRKDPVLGDDVPPQIKGTDERAGDWENIDNAGTHGDVFAHQLMVDAEVAGHVCILVEYPQTGGTQNSRQEQTGEVRPYWVPIYKDQIRSWDIAVVNGKTLLTQLVVCEHSYQKQGKYTVQQVERYRVFHNDDGRVWWELLSVKDKTVVQEAFGYYPTQIEIPVAEVVTSGTKSMFESDPPLIDLAYLNLAHYRQWSDYDTSIHKTCVPVFWAFGINTTDESGQKLSDVVLGPSSAILDSNPAASCGYASHDGASLGSCRMALEDLKNEMGTMALAMLAPQHRSAETAEAKRLDKATTDSALAVTARGLQDGLERASGFHARYYGLDSGGSIEVNRDFEGLLMDAPVMQAYSQLVQAGFPPRAVLQALQHGGRIAADANLDELELEWLMGQADKAAQAAEIAGQVEPEPDPVPEPKVA